MCLDGECSLYNKHNEKFKKGDVIEVIIDRKENKLSFSINEVDFGVACSNLPKDIDLFPSLLLYEQDLNVEII